MSYSTFILSLNPYCDVPDCMEEAVEVLYPHDRKYQRVVCQKHYDGWCCCADAVVRYPEPLTEHDQNQYRKNQ